MKFWILISFLACIRITSAQSNLSGKWQGVLTRAGHGIEKSTLLYLEIENDNGRLTGFSREEKYETPEYCVKQLKGSIDLSKLDFEQVVIRKSSKSSRTKWCRFKAELEYDSLSGFLSGKFVSTDCRRVMGTIKLYRADFEFSQSEEPGTGHLWFEQFLKDERNHLNAPEIRKIERDNFVFEPVFFDYDESFIREEHNAFLLRLIKVVKGHSDLRVKVTGHTDSDGTDEYNVDLSKRRAESIIEFFVKNGLERDRLEFDFKGEKQPVRSNDSPEGKQKNRRVDFSFI